MEWYQFFILYILYQYSGVVIFLLSFGTIALYQYSGVVFGPMVVKPSISTVEWFQVNGHLPVYQYSGVLLWSSRWSSSPPAVQLSGDKFHDLQGEGS